jgi:ATP-dependent DNA helicase Rep
VTTADVRRGRGGSTRALSRAAAGLRDLNPAQREAVLHREGPLLVLAGAGSGKTRVIATKVAQLLATGIAPERIAAVTFTNKAAREMRERLRGTVGSDAAAALAVSTFHTLGLRILRELVASTHPQGCGAAAGLRRGFSILAADDARTLLAEPLRGVGPERDELIERVAWRVSDWKSALLDPAAAGARAADAFERQAAAAYTDYERSLRAYNAVDFDDLISLPARVLGSDAEVRRDWRARYDHILVDEYQDTNAAQYALLKLLAGKEGGFTVVGDDDQSVYAWRGARPENLRDLAADYPALKVVKLEQNYRCSNRILRCANALIRNNPHLFEKALWSARGDGEAVRVVGCRDAEHEVEWVVGAVLALAQAGARHGDVAILYRGNHQARAFEQGLREQRIPYQVSGGSSFLERTEVRDVVAYLRLAANPRDDAAFLRAVNVPRRELGATTLERLAAAAAAAKASMFDAARSAEGLAAVGPRAAPKLAEFTRAVALAAASGTTDPAGALRDLLERIGYRDWLTERAEDEGAAARRIDSVAELEDWMSRVVRELGAGATLTDALAKMMLLDMLERQSEEAADDRVQLMTLHAAKGLEFPHVFLVGVEEELLPHRNSTSEAGLAEERRLAYVGITRAKHTLALTHAARRKRWGEVVETQPSRFLAELPRDELDWRDAVDPDPVAKRARGREALDALRARVAPKAT